MTKHSSWTIASDAGGSGCVTAFGDPDDHLRMTVLLAGALVGEGGARPGNAGRCFDPRAIWRERRAGLEALLAERSQDVRLQIVDIDALLPATAATDPEARWSDPEFRGERAELFDVLVRSSTRGNITFVRPAPTLAATTRLVEAGVQPTEEPEGTRSDASPLETYVPFELRPVVRWLLAGHRMDELELRTLLEASDGEDPSRDIVATAIDVLRPATRRALYRLSALRPAHHLNGSLGPMPLDATADPAHGVDRAEVMRLIEAGLLQRTPGRPTSVRLPRAVRSFAAARAQHAEGERLRPLHQWIAQRALASTRVSTEDALEAHHHAVLSGDLSLALRSVTHYGEDLRLMGRRLGLEGRNRPAAHAEAVEVFRTVVREFAPMDAYSWEYLAFNLERAAPSRTDEILHAYTEASRLDPENPLYRGRLVAFNARLGRDVTEESRRWLRHYGGANGPLGATIFGGRVLEALLERGRVEEARALERWIPRSRS